jgi:hypothetical protein
LVVVMIDNAVVMLSCVATSSNESVPFDVADGLEAARGGRVVIEEHE